MLKANLPATRREIELERAATVRVGALRRHDGIRVLWLREDLYTGHGGVQTKILYLPLQCQRR